MKYYEYCVNRLGFNCVNWNHGVEDKTGWVVVRCESKTMAKRVARLLNADIEKRKEQKKTEG